MVVYSLGVGRPSINEKHSEAPSLDYIAVRTQQPFRACVCDANEPEGQGLDKSQDSIVVRCKFHNTCHAQVEIAYETTTTGSNHSIAFEIIFQYATLLLVVLTTPTLIHRNFPPGSAHIQDHSLLVQLDAAPNRTTFSARYDVEIGIVMLATENQRHVIPERNLQLLR